MSSRYGERGFGRYGDSEEDRTEDRYYEERESASRGQGAAGVRYERGAEYGAPRRGGYSATRGGGYGREYGQERDYDARDLGSREYGSRYVSGEYGPRYNREGLGGGYAAPARRHPGEEYGREYGPRVYGRERVRTYERAAEGDEVRDYDTDYGRTTSRFYGRSGYEYGRDDYDEREGARGEYGRRVREGRGDEREGGGGNWLDRAADQVRSWFGNDEPERGEDPRRAGDPRRAYGRGEGRFRGRGPKNYRRSDDRLREEVCDRLTDNEWLDASDVEVNVAAGEVVLTGTVDSRYAKRLAESIAESVSGVSNVQNSLRVQGYQAGLDAPLPAATSPAPELTAATDTSAASSLDATDLNDPDRPSSRAAGRG